MELIVETDSSSKPQNKVRLPIGVSELSFQIIIFLTGKSGGERWAENSKQHPLLAKKK